MTVRILPPALREKARVEINEDSKRIQEDIQHLKDWLAKQSHIRARTDDQWLLAFLRGCKHSLERSKEKLDLFYSCNTLAPELLNIKHTDSLFDEFLNLGALLILPKTVKPDSSRISIFRPGKWNPDKFNIIDIMSIIWTLSKVVIMDDDHTMIAGSVSVIDLRGVTMSLFLQINPTVMKKIAVVVQDASPVRIMGVHFMHTPPGFETMVNMMKTFMSEKHKNRFYVHNENYNDLYKHVPKDVLPVEYGGNSEVTEQQLIDELKARMKTYSEFLVEESQFGTNESRRPGKPKTAADMFGVEGSFRKLELD